MIPVNDLPVSVTGRNKDVPKLLVFETIQVVVGHRVLDGSRSCPWFPTHLNLLINM